MVGRFEKLCLFTQVTQDKNLTFVKWQYKLQERHYKLFSFYLGYTGQESDFPKMAIQTLGEALQIKVGRVSTNTGIFILALIHVLKYLIICQKKQIQVHRKYLSYKGTCFFLSTLFTHILLLCFVTRPIDRFNLFSTLYNIPPLSVNEMCNSYYHKTNCHHLTLLKRNFQVGDFLLWQQRYGTKKSHRNFTKSIKIHYHNLLIFHSQGI